MKERQTKSRHGIVTPRLSVPNGPANTPDALSEYDTLATREWKSPEFEEIHQGLLRFSEEHDRIGKYASADVHNFEGYDIIEPHLLVLDVTPLPLDFAYTSVGSHVSEANVNRILGKSILELLARNMRKYGIYGHQAEMFCLFMSAYSQDHVFATSRNMVVCVEPANDTHEMKNIDIAAVRATTHGLFPDKIIAAALIAPTQKH